MGRYLTVGGWQEGFRHWDANNKTAFFANDQSRSQVRGRADFSFPDPSKYVIGSIVHHVIWTPGQDFVSDMNTANPVGKWGTTGSGVHAWDNPAYLRTYEGPNRVAGRVALYGLVLPFQHGFLAEKAYPLSFFIHPSHSPEYVRTVEALARTYRVPIETSPVAVGTRVRV